MLFGDVESKIQNYAPCFLNWKMYFHDRNLYDSADIVRAPYPMNIDNSFLGFGVLPNRQTMKATKQLIGLLHGKDIKYITNKIPYLKFLSDHMELHSTI